MQVHFYILSSNSKEAFCDFIVNLTQKICTKSHRVLIYANADLLDHLDQALWQDGVFDFLAHAYIEKAEEGERLPVVLSDKKEVLAQWEDVVIYLGECVLSIALKCQRLIEVGDQEAHALERLRVHYRAFQQQGFLVKTHKLA